MVMDVELYISEYIKIYMYIDVRVCTYISSVPDC